MGHGTRKVENQCSNKSAQVQFSTRTKISPSKGHKYKKANNPWPTGWSFKYRKGQPTFQLSVSDDTAVICFPNSLKYFGLLIAETD